MPTSTWTSFATVGKEQGTTGLVFEGQYGAGACSYSILDSSIVGAWVIGRRLAGHLLGVKNRYIVGLPGPPSVGIPSFSLADKSHGNSVPSGVALVPGIDTVPSSTAQAFKFPAQKGAHGGSEMLTAFSQQ